MGRLLVILIVGLGLVLGEEKLIDLTHTLGYNTVKFPFSPPYNYTNGFRVVINDSIVIVEKVFQTGEHTGTHMDAPRHVCADGKFVHQIPLGKLSGPGVVINLKPQAEMDNDYKVTFKDIKDWETENGGIPQGAVVLFNFGWSNYWPNAEKVFKTNDLLNTSTYHYPTLGLEASRYLSETRKVHAVGVDSPSIDKGLSVSINLLCQHEILILENVDNLDAVPASGSYIYIGAVKLENGSGAPIRLFAVVDDKKNLSLVLGKAKLIDLTHILGPKTVNTPVLPQFSFSNVFTDVINDSIIVVRNKFQTLDHMGTHIDAPLHFCTDGKMAHEIPLGKLSGPGVVIDLKSQATKDDDYRVTLQDILDWEAEHGPIPEGAVVLFNFGWYKYWPEANKVFRTNDLFNSSSFHFPGLGLEASRYLSGTRKVNAVGVDSPSPELGTAIHVNLLCEHGLVILEHVDNLDDLPVTGSQVYIAAVKLENGTGALVRLFATVEDDGNPSGVEQMTLNNVCITLILSMIMVFLSESLGLQV